MEFLREIFGDEPLTYDQLAEKLKGNDKIKVANLATGDYVSKHRLDEAEKLLKEEKSKYTDYDPEWKQKLEIAEGTADEKLNAYKKEQLMEQAFSAAKVKDNLSITPHLKLDDVKIGEDGKLLGLDEQLQTLKQDETKNFLFAEDTTKPESKLNFGGSTGGATVTVDGGGLASAVADYYNEKDN